jgi:hypothetical protein
MVADGGLGVLPGRLRRGRTDGRTLGHVGGLIGATYRCRGLRCRGSGWSGWSGRGAEPCSRVGCRARARHPGESGGASFHLEPAARRHCRHAAEGSKGWRSPRWATDVQGLPDRGRTDRHHRDGRSPGWKHARAALLRGGGGGARADARDDVLPLGGRPTSQPMADSGGARVRDPGGGAFAGRRFRACGPPGGDPDPQRRSDHRMSLE